MSARHIGFIGLAALAACGPTGAPEVNRANENVAEVETVDIPQTVTRLAPGTTPMAQRVATLRLLNKRNGQWREFQLRPGQAARASDAPEIARSAHSLKSSSANVGAKVLSHYCEDIEASARRADTEAARSILAKIETEHDSVLSALSAEFDLLAAKA